MHIKEAREKGKMAQFIRENEKQYPRASKKHFHGLIKAAALGIAKSKQGTSRKGSRAG